MTADKKKYLKLTLILAFFIILIILATHFVNKIKKIEINPKIEKLITVNLLTSVHPSLPWSFKSIKKKILVKPGEVTTIEYIVENLGNQDTAGIATFAYFPKQFGKYISKLNCFCYDAQTLGSKEQGKYLVVLLIDPEVTKDSKTKNVKEVTIQFTFFNYKQYKESKS